MTAQDSDKPASQAHVDQRFDEMMDELKGIRAAFPHTPHGEADLLGHRQTHEEMIRSVRAQEAFWQELKLDLAKKGAWAVIFVVIGLIVVGLAVKFNNIANAAMEAFIR